MLPVTMLVAYATPANLAVDIELKLLGGRVADPHRTRALISGEPVELDLFELALAFGAVHDLELRDVPGARAKRPAPERERLVDVAALEQGVERQH